MAWVYLILAGAFEVAGVTAMNQVAKNKNVRAYLLLVFTFICRFSLLSLAMKALPAGTAYTVWTGIGTVGGTLVGMFFYGEAKDWRRILFIAMIIAAVVSLKLTA